MPNSQTKNYLNTQEVADRLRVDPVTVRRWIRAGELEAVPLGPKAGYRITEEALQTFIKRRQERLQLVVNQ